MARHETNGDLRAPAGLKLTRDEEGKAFIVIMEALIQSETKPATFKELAWTLAVQIVRLKGPKKRGRPAKPLEEEMLIAGMVEDELQRRGQASEDPKAVIRITADLIKQYPYFVKYTPERLKNIYYDARSLYRKLILPLRQQHENSREFPCPKHEQEG